jgi:hypothetical protein
VHVAASREFQVEACTPHAPLTDRGDRPLGPEACKILGTVLTIGVVKEIPVTDLESTRDLALKALHTASAVVELVTRCEGSIRVGPIARIELGVGRRRDQPQHCGHDHGDEFVLSHLFPSGGWPTKDTWMNAPKKPIICTFSEGKIRDAPGC